MQHRLSQLPLNDVPSSAQLRRTALQIVAVAAQPVQEIAVQEPEPVTAPRRSSSKYGFRLNSGSKHSAFSCTSTGSIRMRSRMSRFFCSGKNRSKCASIT